MSSPYCKFVYVSNAVQTTFQPFYPPRKIPAMHPVATRHDNIASSGVKEAVLERIDWLLDLDFPNVPTGDVTSWQSFLQFALAGNSFLFYPDATQSSYSSCTLDSDDAEISYVAPGLYAVKFKMRQVVA